MEVSITDQWHLNSKLKSMVQSSQNTHMELIQIKVLTKRFELRDSQNQDLIRTLKVLNLQPRNQRKVFDQIDQECPKNPWKVLKAS